MALPQAFSFQNKSALLVGLLGGAYVGILFVGFFILNAPPNDLEFFYEFWRTATSSIHNLIALIAPVLAFTLLGFLITYTFILRKSLQGASVTFGSARESDTAKNAFISMALHHIRTPLSGTKWSLNDLRSHPSLSEEDKTAIERLLKENDRALNALNHLISASRASSEGVAYNFEIMSVSELVKAVSEATENLRAEAKEKQITLQTDVKTSEQSLNVDSEKIATVVQTLIENALSYSKSGTSVFIRVWEDGDSLKLSVQDSGLGIPVADQPRVFTQFFRGENAKRADPGGFGIGLFLVRNFVAKHGGTVTFDSKEGVGTTFTVSLPLLKAFSEQYLGKI